MDPLTELGTEDGVLKFVLERTLEHLRALPDADAHPAESVPWDLADQFPLPETGAGSLESVGTLWDLCRRYAVHTTAPRFFDFVIGGVTPAALAADWLTSTFDQNPAGRVTGNLATQVEGIVVGWFKTILGLSSDWHGVMVPSSTYANLAGLASARQWCGEQMGVDVTEVGTSTLPALKVVGSSFTHPSVEKALQMLGFGRRALVRIDLTGPGAGLAAIRNALAEPGPAIVVASAGEINGGRFDPIGLLVDIAEEAGAWLHVDAAFGLGAAFEPTVSSHLQDIDRVDSIATDGHKWLNLPYDCGLAFIRDRELARRTFAMPAAPYLGDLAGTDPGLASLGPDASRRARAFPVFAALAAYGTTGMREMIRRQLGAAWELTHRLRASPHFRVVVEPTLPIVTFRAEPTGFTENGLDRLNDAVAAKVNARGRFAIGSTVERGQRALRVALLNWGVTSAVVEEFWIELERAIADVIREVGR